jgi:DNA-binding transcriptional MocR family regulator
MECDAWRALNSTAQALYPWIKLEWHGVKANNNGKIRLSTRQAARKLGVTISTAARAFHELQAKGFLAVTRAAQLGIGGDASAPFYEITELALPGAERGNPRKLYLEWKEGCDFPVLKTLANNPKGNNGKTKPCHQNHDKNVIISMTERTKAS